MSLYFTQDNDEELKKYYKYTLDSQSAYDISTHLRALFEMRLSELNILGKFDEFELKFKHSKAKIETKKEHKALYDEIVLEYNKIIDSANEIWEYNGELLRDLEFKSKEIYNKIGKTGFEDINKEVLNSQVNSFIKLDKGLVVIKNKINNLINLFI